MRDVASTLSAGILWNTLCIINEYLLHIVICCHSVCGIWHSWHCRASRIDGVVENCTLQWRHASVMTLQMFVNSSVVQNHVQNNYKKTPTIRIIKRNPPVTSVFLSHKASNAKKNSILWSHRSFTQTPKIMLLRIYHLPILLNGAYSLPVLGAHNSCFDV